MSSGLILFVARFSVTAGLFGELEIRSSGDVRALENTTNSERAQLARKREKSMILV